MPLTRHLYKEDEVLAALQFCILRGRCVEAAFWCQELLDSGMADALLAAMRHIWLAGFGIAAIPWFRAFSEFSAADAVDPEKAVELVVSLSRSGRDTSGLILTGCADPPGQVGLCVTPKGLKGPDAFFAAAILQGRAITAWRAWSSIGVDTLAYVAEAKHSPIGRTVCEILVEWPSLAVAALCLPRGDLEKRMAVPIPSPLSEVQRGVAEWESQLDRRSRRQYSIPTGCLYWLTERGAASVYTSNDAQLRGSLERPGKLWGSVYWDSVAEDVGGWEAVRNDPVAREAFYAYLPDDIPDEWPAKDRSNSHGRGVSQPGVPCSVQRFLRSWFESIPSAVIWGKFDSAVKNIEGDTWDTLQPINVWKGDLNMVRLGTIQISPESAPSP